MQETLAPWQKSAAFDWDDIIELRTIAPGELEKKYWSGEQKLMLAVLENAFYSLQRIHGRVSRGAFLGKAEWRFWQQDKDWFLSSDVSWPFSFISICDHLQLDPSPIRKIIRQWRDETEGRLKE